MNDLTENTLPRHEGPWSESARAGAAERDVLLDASLLLRTVRVPLVLLRPDLRIETANHPFHEAFAGVPGAIQGRAFWELGSTHPERMRLRDRLETVLVDKTAIRELEVQAAFPVAGVRQVRIDALPVERAGLPGPSLLVFLEDVTPCRHETLPALDRGNEPMARLVGELRYPLAPMIVALDVLRRRCPADPVVQRQREVIERQVREMARLIDELVDGSQPGAAREPAFRL